MNLHVRAAALACAGALVAGLSTGLAWPAHAADPPLNDRWQDAVEIPALPFHATYDNRAATPDGPYVVPPCPLSDQASQIATLWWRYTPEVSGDLDLSVSGGVAELTPQGPVTVDRRGNPDDDLCDWPPPPVLAGHTYLIGVADRIPEGEPRVPSGGGSLSVLGVKPGRVSAVDVVPGDGSVTVSWQPPPDLANAGITGYTVTVRRGQDVVGREVGPDVRDLTVDGLTNGSTYTVAVVSRRGTLTGYPRTRDVVPSPIVGAPGDLRVEEDRDAGTLTLRWTRASGRIAGYAVDYASDDGNAEWVELPADATSWTTPRLVPWRTYRFRVSTLTDAGVGPEATAEKLLTAAVPSAPAEVTASGGRDGVLVSWEPPAHEGDGAVTGYRVRRYDAAGAIVATADVAADRTTFTVPDAPLGTPFTFDVAAVNAAGVGVASSRTAPAARIRQPAARVTDLQVVGQPGFDTVEVTWSALTGTAVRPVTGYVVTWTDDGGRPMRSEVSVGGSDPTMHLRLPRWTATVVTVAATNAAGHGPVSRFPLFIEDRGPSAPRGVTATAAGDRSLQVRWQEPEHLAGGSVTSYRVSAYLPGQAPAPGNWAVPASTATVAAHARSATLTGLEPGQRYVVQVEALTAVAVGQRGTTAPVRVVGLAGAPRITQVKGGSGAVSVGWQPPRSNGFAAITGYVVTFVRLADDGTVAATLPPVTVGSGSRTASVAAPVPGRYAATVHAVNAAGPGAESARSRAVTVTAAS